MSYVTRMLFSVSRARTSGIASANAPSTFPRIGSPLDCAALLLSASRARSASRGRTLHASTRARNGTATAMSTRRRAAGAQAGPVRLPQRVLPCRCCTVCTLMNKLPQRAIRVHTPVACRRMHAPCDLSRPSSHLAPCSSCVQQRACTPSAQRAALRKHLSRRGEHVRGHTQASQARVGVRALPARRLPPGGAPGVVGSMRQTVNAHLKYRC